MGKSFQSKKMHWLNSVSCDCGVSATSFRVAYIIADHLNSVTETAWPSQNRIAGKICLSSKSVQRATGELERAGWIKVLRRRDKQTSNRYELAWPPKCSRPTAEQKFDADKPVARRRQPWPQSTDSNVRLSYSTNLHRTYSRQLAGEERQIHRFPDRGTYEERIVERFGSDIRELFDRLTVMKPAAIDALCQLEKEGKLTIRDIDAAKLTVLERHKSTA